ncbi:MAG: cupin domain-containing protein [Candidatus Lokiarchaeota archaeon]|nr:cupin domain-containing protein [Candidatus Lokiarchaeota archaeon]
MKNKTIIHKKVWGWEKWLVNKDYCGKLLYLRKGHRCSSHYHKKKDETFYIISGCVLMEQQAFPACVLTAGDIVHIPPGTNHRFTGLENSDIIEFSTHHEDSDSYRNTESEKIDGEEFKSLYKKYK